MEPAEERKAGVGGKGAPRQDPEQATFDLAERGSQSTPLLSFAMPIFHIQNTGELAVNVSCARPLRQIFL